MSHLSSREIRQKFLDYFKKNGHALVPSSSLVPTDPSVLLTTAGMQQFKPYFVGTADPMKDFGSKNTASIQKCFRTSDIDSVGDETHLTFFEMLGNFSFGGYFSAEGGSSFGGKEEAIKYAHEFITGELGLKIHYVSVFEGDSDPSTSSGQVVPKDEESEKIWRSLGVKDIRKAGRKDNFWGPTGSEGPCGPTTEIYVRGVEVWNIVFNEYYCRADKHLEPLKQKGVDTGMGLERLVMAHQDVKNIFETDLFTPIFECLPQEMDEKTKRVFADHVRGISFLISDGVRPSNKEAGYILRRLMRRIIAYRAEVDIKKLFEVVVREYGEFYKELNLATISSVFDEENARFSKTLSSGLKELSKVSEIDAKSAFKLYESFGLPYETTKEVAGEKARKLDREGFDEEFKRHQAISRAGMEKKFGGHGLILNTGELKVPILSPLEKQNRGSSVTHQSSDLRVIGTGSEEELNKVLRLHTATHLLQQALREVLGLEVKQAGSDITAERTRFDFSFPRKLTLEEIKKVEDLVNQKIKEDLPVNFKEMPKEEAEKTGALYFFSAKGGSTSGGKEKYPDVVKIYYIGQSLDNAWSKEFCGGPHVTHTGVIGPFKISKEEAVGAGVRRIRGVVFNG